MAPGTLKWFNGEKGYKRLADNQRVEFDTTERPTGPQAENVRAV